MTTMAEWNLNPQQFWLHDQQPAEPVCYDEDTELWNVYGYPEAHQILSDPKTFSSDIVRALPSEQKEKFSGLSEGQIVQMDAPEHTRLRKLITHAFTPKVVADLEPRISELTTELLDAVAGGQRMELVADLAYPLPVIVIAELLGVPSSDRGLFKKWVDGLFVQSQGFSLKDSEQQQRQQEAQLAQIQPLLDYLREHAEQRRRSPREDLLSKLVQAEVDGQRLNMNQVVNFADLLLIAGHITTTMLLGNTVLCLDAHPRIQDEVRADRGRVPAAIEESLRFLSPFATLVRVTTTETELGGRTVPADQLLMVWIAAANRDRRQFAHPEVFDLGREPNQHIAFGRGVHFCVGAPLARLEGRVALNLLLDRFPRLRTDPEHGPEFLQSPNITGIQALPLLLS